VVDPKNRDYCSVFNILRVYTILGVVALSFYRSVVFEKVGNLGVSYNIWLLQMHIKHSLPRPAHAKYLDPVTHKY